MKQVEDKADYTYKNVDNDANTHLNSIHVVIISFTNEHFDAEAETEAIVCRRHRDF